MSGGDSSWRGEAAPLFGRDEDVELIRSFISQAAGARPSGGGNGAVCRPLAAGADLLDYRGERGGNGLCAADRDPRFGGADHGNAMHQTFRDGAVTGVRDRRSRVGQDQAWETGRTATMFRDHQARQVRPGWP